MADNMMMSKKNRILMGLYRSSHKITLLSLIIVGGLEIMMLFFSVVYRSYYEDRLWKYRALYIVLLSIAIAYIILNLFVKDDMERRYKLLNIANPLYAVLFFSWAMVITYFDSETSGRIDPTIFMTFSMMIPLGSYLVPSVYAVIVTVADILMLTMMVTVNGPSTSLVNVLVFFVFQYVLGISFLQLRIRLAKRIVEEQDNARIDVMTGCMNRRMYTTDMKLYSETPMQDDFIYMVVDINGLKYVNDNYGHDSGDKFIIGAANCLVDHFGSLGKIYRIGGDEFAVIFRAEQAELEGIFSRYEESMKEWSKNNDLLLCTSYGYIRHNDYPDKDINELAKMADEKMYEAKEHYYETSGQPRR